MAKRVKSPCVEFMLQVINFVFMGCGLSLLDYGLLCFIKWKQSPSLNEIQRSNTKFMIVHRFLLAIEQPEHSSSPFPKLWFIYLLIGIGAIFLLVSCFGCIGTSTRSPCCLRYYCLFMVAIAIIELGTATFIFFKHNWEEVMPKDRSGNFDRICRFLNVNWKVMRWIVLGLFIFQVISMFLAVYLRSVFNCDWSDIIGNDRHIMYRPTNRIQPTIRVNGSDPARPTEQSSPI